MKNNNYIKFILIIIVLLLLVIIGLLAIPRMDTAREQAFKIEAVKIVDAAQNAMEKYNSGSIKTENTTASCKKETTYCFTVSKLKQLKTYIPENDNYVGKVEIDLKDKDNPQYILYLKKSADLKMVFATTKNYINMGSAPILNWSDEYETCECE